MSNLYVFSNGFKFTFFITLFALLPAVGHSACSSEDSDPNQSLVLTIDISTSIEEAEAVLQLQAYQTSLERQSVQDKLLGCGCTEISVVLFASEAINVIEPTNIVDESDISELIGFFTNTITASQSVRYLSDYFQINGGTSVLRGLQTSLSIVRRDENTAFRNAILVSGDGVNDVFAEREFSQIREESEYHGIEITGVPVITDAPSNLCSAYPGLDELNPGSGDACSTAPMQPSFGARSAIQSSPRGLRYGSITDFYERFVANSYGTVNTASSFEDLAETLSETIERMACMPMM